jgi:hypothetical protein
VHYAILFAVQPQVSKCYPKDTTRLAPQLMDLLDTHATVLDAALRRTIVQVCVYVRVCVIVLLDDCLKKPNWLQLPCTLANLHCYVLCVMLQLWWLFYLPVWPNVRLCVQSPGRKYFV